MADKKEQDEKPTRARRQPTHYRVLQAGTLGLVAGQIVPLAFAEELLKLPEYKDVDVAQHVKNGDLEAIYERSDTGAPEAPADGA